MTRFRRHEIPCAVFALVAFSLGFASCGGGSSSGGGTGGTPSYSLAASSPTPSPLTAGNSSTSTITLTPSNSYTGSVTLSCSSITGGSPAPTCSFNPSSVSVRSSGTATSTLTLASTTGTPGGPYTITVTGADASNAAPSNGPQNLALTMSAAIQHIVVIFQENRTPDNLFQDPVLISRGADLKSSGLNSLGQTIPLSPINLGTAGPNPQNYDLSHAHAAFVSMYDNGKMDGADLITCSPAAECPPNAHPNAQFMYVVPSDVQPYFTLAEQYTFGDRMFQTNEGPSFPAHQFIISGTSAPSAGSNLFAAENPNNHPAGCIAPLAETVAVVDPFGSESTNAPIYPCFEHPTLTDELDTAGISWKYYTPSAGSIWTGPDAIQHICQEQTVNGTLTCTGPDWVSDVVIPQSQVLVDLANQHLAQVTWVIPDGQESDHALSNDGSGPSWVASIVNAIGNSPFWQNTMIIITWDDWGGWYDHVAPKVINDGVSWGSGYAYGFRVPLIVVGPYAKTQYISHVNHDFGSILKYIETNFNLPSLGYADAPADDLSDCFQLTSPPTTFKLIPAIHQAAYFINDKRPPTDPDDDN
ncbi:MAG TPA: alkaline phosphatase family protein [Candidatus Acidoferrales bacterium]|nr:alkaline phosphatase family protein [Candidatus Acidoferrales bacterium]